jgi:dTDP-4-amino-4,6-dideoxygalactose transaminase
VLADLLTFSGTGEQEPDGQGRHYFGYARCALLHLLRIMGVGPGDEILIPTFICDIVLAPLERLGCHVAYYGIDDRFRVDFATMAVSSRTKAILTVNYFGLSNDLDGIADFAAAHRLIWINDNAHGFAGLHGDNPLERYGDASITSFRKVMPVLNGAYSCLNNPGKCAKTAFPTVSLPLEAPYRFWFKSLLGWYGIERPLPDYSLIDAFTESSLQEFSMDRQAETVLRLTDQEDIRRKRRDLFQRLDGLLGSRNSRELEWDIELLRPGNSPLAFPLYVRDHATRERLLVAARRERIDIHTWPSLPGEVLESDVHGAATHWRQLVVVPLHQRIDRDRYFATIQRVLDAI